MEWKAAGVMGAVLLMTPALLGAQAGASASQNVVIRSYNNAGVPAEDLRPAQDRAAAILREAGVAVTWMDCWFRDGEPAGASPRCRQPRHARDLVLRLQASSEDARGGRYVSMGFSLVSAGPDTAFLSTVFVDRVQSVARGSALEFAHLLGLAIAHEIGHLLLNTNSHASSGLMRAGWSRNELRRNSAGDWRFLDTEAATMQAALALR